VSIIVETKHYAGCPECGGKVGSIDHMASDEVRAAGPWFCDDCGRGWTIRTNGRDVCDLELFTQERRVPVTVTLVLPPQKEPVVFVLHDHKMEESDRDEAMEQARYFYEEHTCPTNWMRNVEEIRIGDNDDPHGLFRFESIEPGHQEVWHNRRSKP
jgi:hypothetical protein